MDKDHGFSRVIMPALTLELKWTSKTGMSYQIEESTDLIHWLPAVPALFPGTGNEIIWMAPQQQTRKTKCYRVREL